MDIEELQRKKPARISILEAAEIMDVNPQFLRIALQQGRFSSFGVAIKRKHWAYYINTERFIKYMRKVDEESIYTKHEKWLFNRTQEELALATKACEFEDLYFTDMTLNDFEEKLTKCEAKINGKWQEFTEDIVEPGGLNIWNKWRFY